jgi:hypothetical protein
MALISRNTDLKSLRYGKDRVGGGNSNQPYIKSPIPENRNQLDRSGGIDFLLRGGTLTPSRAVEDVSRLTKMFGDFKSPNGVLFTAKQNLLSRTGVKTQASGILNEGVYLPTSTILQVAGNAFGIHLNKQGLDPTKRTGPDAGQNNLFNLLGLRDPLGLPVYTENLDRIQSEKTNRLVQLKYKKIGPDKIDPTSVNATTAGLINNLVRSNIFSTLLSPFNQISSNPKEILKYGGGPGSTLGVGKTILKRYSDTNEGETKAKTAQSEKKSLYGKTPFKNITPTQTSKDGVFTLRNSYLYTNTNDGLNFDKVGNSIFKGRYYVLDAKTIFNKTSSKDSTEISDFRKDIPSTQKFPGGKKNILSAAPDYKTKNIEQRVNLGDPGKRNKNTTSYTTGLLKSDGTKYGALDKINATPLYQSSKANHSGDRNDLVKFSIGIISNDRENGPDPLNPPPLKRTYIHFRAFLDSMDDSYAAEWNDFRYMGRGEKFYRYNGFTRTINLSWTVAAQSKEELIPMYQKLNFLASSLAPDYSANGYMRGNLAVLTIGGYLFEQPGIINSINYSVPTESPWEIGISDTAGFDHTVKEMPHIIRVTGFSFTPIHTFVPKLQKNTYDGTYANKDGTLLTDPNSAESKIVVSGFGKERYIALSKDTALEASTTNYNSPNDYTWGPTAQARRKIVQNDAALSNVVERSRPSIENTPLSTPTVPGIITSR